VKIPKGGGKKDLGKRIFLLNSICEEAGRCRVCWGKEMTGFLVVMNTTEFSVRQEESVGTERHLLRSFPSFPSWTHGQARG
jgi:hypothetical protein